MFTLLMQQQCHKYVNICILNSVLSSLDFPEKMMITGIIMPAALYGRILRILCFAFYEQKTSKNIKCLLCGSLILPSYLSQSFLGYFVVYSILCIAKIRMGQKDKDKCKHKSFQSFEELATSEFYQKAVKKKEEPHVHEGQGAETEMTQHFRKRVKA